MAAITIPATGIFPPFPAFFAFLGDLDLFLGDDFLLFLGDLDLAFLPLRDFDRDLDRDRFFLGDAFLLFLASSGGGRQSVALASRASALMPLSLGVTSGMLQIFGCPNFVWVRDER